MRFYLLLLLTVSTILGCQQNSNSDNELTYFGGEIKNPNNDYVLLYLTKDKADTLLLDKENRFFTEIPFIKAGMYKFLHGGEYQMILLEPKDSILLRLNTIDFDESLVYTGKGARKNNYLVKTFLENEDDNQKFMQLCQLEPKQFEIAVDSMRAKKLKELTVFLDNRDYSDLFKNIAETSINYNYYANKELYPFGYFGYNNLIHHNELPENFYDFRNEVDYNNEEMVELIPYNKFLFSHFNNLALTEFFKNTTHNVIFNNKSVAYNLQKLHLMDSLITNGVIKNNLLRYTARDFISTCQDSTETNEVLTSFLEKSSNNEDKIYIEDLVKSLEDLRPGKTLPNIKLLDFDENETNVASLITKPTVIYFWSSNLPMLLRNSHYKARNLKNKFPEVDFIAININDDDASHWKKTLQQLKFSPVNEYQFKYPNLAQKTFAINSVNKSILVDKDMKIVNPNALLFSSEFEDQIKTLVQKKETH